MRLFNRIIKAYKTDIYEYEIQEPVDNIKTKIEDLIQGKDVFQKYNLIGNLYKNNKFTLVRKWSLLSINFIDRHPVTLNGRFYYVETGLTRIKLEVRPNFIFVLLSTLFGGAGMLSFFKSLSTDNLEFGVLFFMLAVPVLYTMALFTKKDHQKDLNLTEKYLVKAN